MLKTGLSYLLRASIYSFILYSIFSTVTAQTFTNFGNSSNSNSNTTSATTTSSKPAMSAEEYKNMVKNLGKQNQDELTKTVKQDFSSQQPAPPVTMPAPAAPVISTTPESSPVQKTMPATVAPVMTAPPPEPVITAAPPTQTAPAASSVPVAPAPAAPAQNQTYTGFGSPDTNKTGTGGDQSKESTGWKIQY